MANDERKKISDITNAKIKAAGWKMSDTELCPCGSGKKYKRCCGEE